MVAFSALRLLNWVTGCDFRADSMSYRIKKEGGEPLLRAPLATIICESQWTYVFLTEHTGADLDQQFT